MSKLMAGSEMAKPAICNLNLEGGIYDLQI